MSTNQHEEPATKHTINDCNTSVSTDDTSNDSISQSTIQSTTELTPMMLSDLASQPLISAIPNESVIIPKSKTKCLICYIEEAKVLQLLKQIIYF